METSDGPFTLPSDPRVRPMSAAELRRGEQSALHCSGTRTLQVRNFPPPTPPAPPKNYLEDASFVAPDNFAQAPPSAGPAPSPLPVPLGEPPGRGPRRSVPLRRSAGRGVHAGGRVPGLRCAAPGGAGAARVSEAPGMLRTPALSLRFCRARTPALCLGPAAPLPPAASPAPSSPSARPAPGRPTP